MQLARLEGPRRRSFSGGLQVGNVPVQLAFQHRVGPPSGPLLLDADGAPFADEGDGVVCGSGFAPSGPVRGEHGIFVVGQIARVPVDHRRELDGG
jgi:hypothetical protein